MFILYLNPVLRFLELKIRIRFSIANLQDFQTRVLKTAFCENLKMITKIANLQDFHQIVEAPDF